MTYLNNPLDGNSLDVFRYVQYPELVNVVGSGLSNVNPNITDGNVFQYANLYRDRYGRDPFFANLLAGGDEAFMDRLFNQSSVDGSNQTFLAQTVSSSSIPTGTHLPIYRLESEHGGLVRTSRSRSTGS